MTMRIPNVSVTARTGASAKDLVVPALPEVDVRTRVVMATGYVGKPAMIVELEELDLALDELRQLFDAEDGEVRSALRRLEEDGADLARLDEMLSGWREEVDIFDVLRLDGSEEFHSNFLAWLLDPKGSHGLGDNFLRGFLLASGASCAIRAVDRPSTEVQREKSLELEGGYGRLDIWMLNENADFICAIENKVWSPESGDQLAWYRKVLARDHHGQRVHLVFLTPLGARPDDPAEREHWTTMSYTDILRLVEGTMAAAGDTANEDVLAFLRQYAITLRRNIVPEVSNDVHELARRIYRKHKRAIDLIIEHRESYEPNYVTEGFWMVRESIGKQPLWKERTCNRPYVRFVSTAWEEFEQLKMGTWPHHLLLFEVQVTDSRAELFLTLFKGGDKSLRKQIFDRVRANADVFDCEEPAYSAESIRLHTVGNVLEESDYDSWWDEERTREIIDGRLVDFAQGQLAAIDKIVVECLEKHRAGMG